MFQVVGDTENFGDLQAIYTSPSGNVKDLDLTKSATGRTLKNSFVPDRVGELCYLGQGQYVASFIL